LTEASSEWAASFAVVGRKSHETVALQGKCCPLSSDSKPVHDAGSYDQK
jgi:hypothetical protein